MKVKVKNGYEIRRLYQQIQSGRFIRRRSADGGSLMRLTSNSAADWFPRWSPDGDRVAYVNSSDGNDKIYVMNADGGRRTLLTDTPVEVSDWNPTWSPDGKQLAFMSTRRYRGVEIYVMNADRRSEMFLTSGTEPKWSPGKAAATTGINQ